MITRFTDARRSVTCDVTQGPSQTNNVFHKVSAWELIPRVDECLALILLMNSDRYRKFYLWKTMPLFMFMHLSAVDGMSWCDWIKLIWIASRTKFHGVRRWRIRACVCVFVCVVRIRKRTVSRRSVRRRRRTVRWWSNRRAPAAKDAKVRNTLLLTHIWTHGSAVFSNTAI